MTKRTLLAAALAAAGCTPPTPAVRGAVTLDGAAVGGAVVRFHPDGKDGAAPYVTVTRADGTFDVPAGNDGRAALPPGKYAVTVAKYSGQNLLALNSKQVAALKSQLPAGYADPARTPLAVTLANGTNVLDLKLTAN